MSTGRSSGAYQRASIPAVAATFANDTPISPKLPVLTGATVLVHRACVVCLLVGTACVSGQPSPSHPSTTEDAAVESRVAAPEARARGSERDLDASARSLPGLGPRGAARPRRPELTLPEGLEQLSWARFADDWVYLASREGDDLVVMLVDADGVVVDDVTAVGLGGHTVVLDCDADTAVAVIPADACPGEAQLVATRAWTHDGPQLTAMEGLECWCPSSSSSWPRGSPGGLCREREAARSAGRA